MHEEAFAAFLGCLVPPTGRAVEIGVGHADTVVRRLRDRRPAARILVTDIDPRCLRTHRRAGLEAAADDVTTPDRRLYEGAALVYAHRCPPELVYHLGRLADDVGAHAAVTLLADDADALSRPPWRPVADGGRIIAWWRPARGNRGSAAPQG